MSPTRRGFLQGALVTAGAIAAGGVAGGFKRPAIVAPPAPPVEPIDPFRYQPVTIVTDALRVPPEVDIHAPLKIARSAYGIEDIPDMKAYYDQVLLERTLAPLAPHDDVEYLGYIGSWAGWSYFESPYGEVTAVEEGKL